MAIRRYIVIIVAFLALTAQSCESENMARTQPEKSIKFTTVITDLTMDCNAGMISVCDIDCRFIHANKLSEQISRYDGKVFQDTIDITNVKNFPIVLQFYINATPNDSASQPVDLKYSYGMTVCTQNDDFSVIDSNDANGGDGDSKRQVEPDSIETFLRKKLPVTLTATITKEGKITIK